MHKIIHTVGNMVRIPPKEEISKHTGINNIIFVGKMSYDPNVVAVTYFVNEIFPELRRSHPSLEFIIVGSQPTEQIKRLENINGVKVTGFVERIVPFFLDATIVVAPMLTGAGIQNKIIQAMSYGCCVATTPIGAEGLAADNKEIAIFNSTEEWIEGINYLLSNKDLRIKMGNLAREYVINNLSPQVISVQFWNFINSGGLNIRQ